MFKIIITDSVYQDIIRTEEQRPSSGRSHLYQLLMQQPVQQLSAEQTEKLRQHPEEVLKNPSALYILQISHTEALAIQKAYGVMCVNGDSPDISLLIDINDVHFAKEQEKLGHGWDTVLDSVEPLPSNARFVANQLERIYIQHAMRCVRQNPTDKRQLRLLTPEDILPIDAPKEKRHIGFC